MAIMLTQRIPAQLQDNIPEPSQVLPVLELTLADRQRCQATA